MSTAITGRNVAFAIRTAAELEQPHWAFHLDFRNGIKENQIK